MGESGECRNCGRGPVKASWDFCPHCGMYSPLSEPEIRTRPAKVVTREGHPDYLLIPPEKIP
jgi:hypothetical protein